MSHRLIGRAGLALFAGLALAVAGCADNSDNGGTSGPPASPASPDTPADSVTFDLASSADVFSQDSFKFDLVLGDFMTATGAADPAVGASTVTMDMAMPGMPAATMEMITTESDAWLNMGAMAAALGGGAGDWLHLDLDLLGSQGLMGIQPDRSDPAGAAALLENLGEVTQVDDHTFEGTVDLTQVEGSALANEQTLSQLGAEASKLPFTARIDDQGRLVSFVMEIPAIDGAPAQTLEVTYHDFGAPVDVTPPPADQVTEAPDVFYGMFSA